MTELAGRTALVTGAASGIGRACAQRLAADGARVVLVDIDADVVTALAAELGGKAVPADLSEPTCLDALDLDVDIVVNSAGVQHVAPVEHFPPATFARLLRLMLEAPFWLVRGALPYMYRRGFGRIVNISSVHGLRASPYKAAYVAAKHGLEGFSKVVALEGAARGVTSNCVSPGYVRTPLVEAQVAAQAERHGIAPAEVVERVMLAPSAVKRLIEPAEVAAAVAYLVGPHASFITGTSLVLDGGWTAH